MSHLIKKPIFRWNWMLLLFHIVSITQISLRRIQRLVLCQVCRLYFKLQTQRQQSRKYLISFAVPFSSSFDLTPTALFEASGNMSYDERDVV